MLPPVDLQGGFPLCAARAASVTALLSALGTSTFRTMVVPKATAFMAPEAAASFGRRMRLVTRWSAAAGIAANCVWLLLQAGQMADADSVRTSFAAVPAVLGTTLFGHVILAQTATLLVLLALACMHDRVWRQWVALGLATLALVLQAGHSHAYAMYDGRPSLLLACEILHLLAAGAWLGGLAPLLLLVRDTPAKAGATAARWFSPLGKGCVAALLVSAAFQGWTLVGTVPGLVGTAYGWTAMAKLVLFAVLLGFAAANRYCFAPALLHGDAGLAKQVLIRSIFLQTGFAVAIIVVAAVLSELPPSMHEQPVWPFATRFSLAAIDEDPDFRREVTMAASAIGGAMLVLIAALVSRRFRLLAFALAAVVGWFAVPHLDLLLVPAYPTSFYHSPTGFAAASIVTGRAVYERNCVECHGVDGRGDGPAAQALPVPPAHLTAAHLWMHSDGELFWWLAEGMRTPEGTQAMPGFAGVLDDDQRWAVIDFIRGRNAGGMQRMTGSWSPPVQAPGFDAECKTSMVRSSALRGKFMLLTFGRAATASARNTLKIISGDATEPASSDICIVPDETVPEAYAIVSGVDAASLPGTAFLIDDQGWLRALQRPGATSPWRDAAALDAALRSLRAHPVTDSARGAMKMPMDMKM